MTGHREQRSTASERAARTVKNAWEALPEAHRNLLREVGASQWTLLEEPLGLPAHRLLRSAGLDGLSKIERDRLQSAVAVWIPQLGVVAFNIRHPFLIRLNGQAWEYAVVTTAWHEWGHALSIARCTAEDIAAGGRLLELAPTSVSNSIRAAGYCANEYTHELVANIYALMVERHQRKEPERPPWLNREIYDMLARVTGWPEDDR